MTTQTTMHRDDDRMTIDRLKGRIVEYLREPTHGRMFGHLMVELGLQKGKRLPSGLAESRALDRALQELRKAGRIKFAKCEWWPISNPDGAV